MKNRSCALLLILALAGALAACQGQDQKATRPPATAAPPGSSAPVSTGDDRATAQRLVLTKADFPAGWKPVRFGGAPISLEDVSGTTHAFTAKVTGKAFGKGSQVAGSGASIVRPGEDLALDAAAFRSPEFTRTLKNELGKAIIEGNPGAGRGAVTVKKLPIAEYGQYSIGYRITAKMTMRGIGIAVYEDWVWLASGRMEVGASFANVDRPFDPALQRKLIAALGTRLTSVAR
ncbi:MAG TPA: hypothetical protein VFU43_10450 [Streptosporangiaceae bacterium]|nr:hypothetical protein [Streptosporangiaceae bacterium]